MRIPRRGPDTGMSLTAGTGHGGRHRKKDENCTYTWGTCKRRTKNSNAEPGERGSNLPHLCGEGKKNHTGPHCCTVCQAPQS